MRFPVRPDSFYNRLGQFRISRNAFFDFSEVEMISVFDRMIVLDVQCNFMEDSITYRAVHRSFDIIGYGVIIPFYLPTVSMDETGEFTVTWEKVENEDMLRLRPPSGIRSA